VTRWRLAAESRPADCPGRRYWLSWQVSWDTWALSSTYGQWAVAATIHFGWPGGRWYKLPRPMHFPGGVPYPGDPQYGLQGSSYHEFDQPVAVDRAQLRFNLLFSQTLRGFTSLAVGVQHTLTVGLKPIP